MKIKILELFGGIGACSKAFEKLGIPYEIVDYVEIDKHAVDSFNAIHNTNYQPQNITEWNKDIDVDLIMHGSPCQDFSLAGKQAGGDKDSGTRSSLMYETIRIVEKLKPKIVIWENVKNLISKKHKHNFDAYIDTMKELGYISYYQVLNAKDYGIPQNRERVFTVSILDNHTEKDEKISLIVKDFKFPEKKELKLKLKDMLEDSVDESFYLTEDKIEKISHWNAYQKPFKKVNGNNSIVPTITARGAGENHSGMITYSDRLEETTNLQEECLHIKNATKKGYLEAYDGDGIDISSRMQYHRGNVQKDSIQTLDCTGGEGHGVVVKNLKQKLCDQLIETNQVSEGDVIKHSYTQQILDGKKKCVEKSDGIMITLTTRGDCVGTAVKDKSNNLRIRKLTPKECWRLMGFEDEDYERASKVNTKSQLYKQAGNSIVVNVLEEIIKQLIEREN